MLTGGITKGKSSRTEDRGGDGGCCSMENASVHFMRFCSFKKQIESQGGKKDLCHRQPLNTLFLKDIFGS